jgi:hypothetical protein
MSASTPAVALAAALVLAATTGASADPIETSFTFTLNALDGEHAFAQNTISRIDFVPLPLAELNARHDRDELHLEGLPPVAFSYNSGSGVGLTTTRLSILNTTYRRTVGDGWWVGIGETLYNQHTTYATQNGAFYTRFATAGMPATVYPIFGSEEQFSRVSGARYELGRRWRLGATTLEAMVAVNPAMHGIQYTYVPTGGAACPTIVAAPPAPVPKAPPPPCPNGNPTFGDAERATQLDLSVRAAHPAGRNGRFLYGLRYLHYSARYDDDPGQLSDRNLGLAPLVGYEIRL